MVENHSDRERKPATATTWITLFLLIVRCLLYSISHRQDSTYHDLWNTWNEKYLIDSIMTNRSHDPSHCKRMLGLGGVCCLFVCLFVCVVCWFCVFDLFVGVFVLFVCVCVCMCVSGSFNFVSFPFFRFFLSCLL